MDTESDTIISHADAAALANRLTRRRAGPTLSGAVAILEADAVTAGRLIRALLRGTRMSDMWQLPPEM